MNSGGRSGPSVGATVMLSALAEWISDGDPTTVDMLRRRLRCTDRWCADGERFRVLLDDCDEFDAVRVLAGIEVYDGQVRLAGRDDLASLGTPRP